jgi:hypothetical protein
VGGQFFTRCNPAADYEPSDCAFDTYFDTRPEWGEWLTTHWNLGSTNNTYVHFGEG